MKLYRRNITPVLLGADLNAYSVALSFREAYGVKSHVLARYRCGATENSRFIKTHITPGIDSVEVAVPELLRLAAENTRAELFLIPCADWYVEMLMGVKSGLSDLYAMHLPGVDVWRMLSDKCELYKTLSGEGISCPDYVEFEEIGDVTDSSLMKIPYPAVVKPADSSEYWRNPFPDMRKVYFPRSFTEAKDIIYSIFASGYSKRVILQRHVGGVSQNRVLTTVSDKEGRVVRAVMGDVILIEQQLPNLLPQPDPGNHHGILCS